MAPHALPHPGARRRRPRARARVAGRPALRRLLAAARRGPYEPALVVTVLVAVFGGLFVASYALALGRPKPRHIATDVVGDGSRSGIVAALERAAGTSLTLRPVASVAAAREDIDHQRAYAAIVLGPDPPRLLVAGAAGSSVARVLEQAAQTATAGRPDRLTVTDVRPLPPADPNGLVIFYATLAATIMGFVSMFQLRAHASALTLRAWLGFLLGLATLTGLTVSLVSGPVIGALGGAFAEKWLILSLECFTAGAVCSTLLVLIGRWAILPTWLLFVLLGNTSSGGAVATPLLPGPYEFIGRWLSPGATVEALRGAVYFRGTQHVEPAAVLLAWASLGLVALLVAVRRTGALPTGARAAP